MIQFFTLFLSLSDLNLQLDSFRLLYMQSIFFIYNLLVLILTFATEEQNDKDDEVWLRFLAGGCLIIGGVKGLARVFVVDEEPGDGHTIWQCKTRWSLVITVRLSKYFQGGEVEHLGCSHVSKQIYLVTLQTTDGAQQIDNESMVGLGFGVDFATLDLTGG